MPWIALPSGTPYFVTKLPEGAKEIPAPNTEPEPKPEKPAVPEKTKADEKK